MKIKLAFILSFCTLLFCSCFNEQSTNQSLLLDELTAINEQNIEITKYYTHYLLYEFQDKSFKRAYPFVFEFLDLHLATLEKVEKRAIILQKNYCESGAKLELINTYYSQLSADIDTVISAINQDYLSYLRENSVDLGLLKESDIDKRYTYFSKNLLESWKIEKRISQNMTANEWRVYASILKEKIVQTRYLVVNEITSAFVK